MTASTICSSILGPAMFPSFVTWPMIIMGMPLFFAAYMSWAQLSFTWFTLPATESRSSLKVVCMESMTARAGFSFSMIEVIFSMPVSTTSMSFSALTPVLSARSFICSKDSSPEKYMTLFPARATLSAMESASVDFPTPGSPPIKTREPLTMPPPNTRSISSMPVLMRCSFFTFMSASALILVSSKPRYSPDFFLSITVSSMYVLNSLHTGQRPSHLGDDAPQFEQLNKVFVFAKMFLSDILGRGFRLYTQVLRRDLPLHHGYKILQLNVLCFFACAFADRHRIVFHFLIAYYQHVRYLIHCRSPDLRAYFLVIIIKLGPYAGFFEFFNQAARYLRGAVRQCKHCRLDRGEPDRESSFVMLYENPEKSFKRTEQGAVYHDHPLFLSVFAYVVNVKPLRQVKINLYGRALPGPVQCVFYFYVYLGPVKSAAALIHAVL